MAEDQGLSSMAEGTSPEFLFRVRADMLAFARQQLGDDSEAEDVVQEALAGALRSAASFRGEAALKTWIIAILKNKIYDLLRKRQRRRESFSQMPMAVDEGPLPDFFDPRGMWHDAARPAQWEDPEADLNSRQFLEVFDACLHRLPAQQGRVFLMREVVDLETPEICLELGLSVSNVHVILHRARLALRACLETHWFGEGAVSK